MRQCKVFVHDVEAGILMETDDHEYVFAYHDDYHGEPVCLAMPIRREPYCSAHLFPFFYNMLSEGSNRQVQSMLHHIDENDDFGIMLVTAQHDTIGAVTIKPMEQQEQNGTGPNSAESRQRKSKTQPM